MQTAVQLLTLVISVSFFDWSTGGLKSISQPRVGRMATLSNDPDHLVRAYYDKLVCALGDDDRVDCCLQEMIMVVDAHEGDGGYLEYTVVQSSLAKLFVAVELFHDSNPAARWVRKGRAIRWSTSLERWYLSQCLPVKA